MHNSTLVTLLKTLSKNEFSELEKFISSPYFSRERDCTALLQVLKVSHPQFEGSDILKESVFEKLYPARSFNDPKLASRFSSMCGELYKLCKEFLIISGLAMEETQKRHLLLKQLNRKKLQKEFTSEYKKVTENRSEGGGGADRFLDDYHLSQVYASSRQQHGDMNGLFEANKNGGDNALAFALIMAYRYLQAKDVALSFGIEPGYSFSSSVMENLDAEKMLDSIFKNNDPFYPQIAAYVMQYKMINDIHGEKYSDKLGEILETYRDKFGHTEKYILYNALGQILVKKGNKDNSDEMTRKLFSIYKKILEEGVYKYTPQDIFNPTLYRNILSTAFELRELKWAENFIHTTSGELPEDLRQSMRDYSFANLYFLSRDFPKALGYIVNIKYDYYLHKIDAKVLQFKIYYELSSFEQAYSVIDTAKHYLAGKGISQTYKERNMNFLKYAYKLVKTKTSSGRKDTGFIIKKLENEKAVESKGWLISKMEGIAEDHRL